MFHSLSYLKFLAQGGFCSPSINVFPSHHPSLSLSLSLSLSVSLFPQSFRRMEGEFVQYYINEKFSEAETNHNYNTKFVENQNLVHPNVRTSKIFKSFFL